MLSDNIEKFINDMMRELPTLEMHRSELAEYFGCAPSQINYVLATRFTPNNGYYVQSRRGGGGYIRIVRINTQGKDYLAGLILRSIPDQIGETDARRIIEHLYGRELITRREAKLIEAAMASRALPLPVQLKEEARARLLKQMLGALQSAANQEEPT